MNIASGAQFEIIWISFLNGEKIRKISWCNWCVCARACLWGIIIRRSARLRKGISGELLHSYFFNYSPSPSDSHCSHIHVGCSRGNWIVYACVHTLAQNLPSTTRQRAYEAMIGCSRRRCYSSEAQGLKVFLSSSFVVISQPHFLWKRK